MEPFLSALGRVERRRWAPVYLHGVLSPAPRKNVEQMAEQVAPGELQQLHSLEEEDFQELSWREGTQGPLLARFAAMRVRAAEGPRGEGKALPGEEALWPVCEWRSTGENPSLNDTEAGRGSTTILHVAEGAECSYGRWSYVTATRVPHPRNTAAHPPRQPGGSGEPQRTARRGSGSAMVAYSSGTQDRLYACRKIPLPAPDALPHALQLVARVDRSRGNLPDGAPHDGHR